MTRYAMVFELPTMVGNEPKADLSPPQKKLADQFRPFALVLQKNGTSLVW
eukprot:CAMPEP_0184698432 /NCGR_PEP_ID=MMETSP0313-20130426/5067_1 /TAXON_ID=2792 /ORGANISM="Porphyridium aerugineum, Strain SAG 1380-2" /LENGTH=49 /DNA_ID= /DNA_START= /DNA_END= /DNA_ORIENTATION=